jgi:hypothetical protein
MRMDDGRLSPKRSRVSYKLEASTILAVNKTFHVLSKWAGNFDANSKLSA